jgi:hypothetical protein
MSRRAMRVTASDEQRWAEIDAQVAPLFGYWVDVILSGHDTKDRVSLPPTLAIQHSESPA